VTPGGPRSARLAERTTAELDLLAAGGRPVVLLLPVGATEPHGPHAPLATDTIISTRVCTDLARRLGDHDGVEALVLPEIPYGVTRCAAGFRGAVGVAEQTLHDLVVDVLSSAAADGFRVSAIVNNHFEPAHIAVLQRAIDTLEQRDVRVAYVDLTRRARAARLSEEFQRGACHAGRYETSIVLAERPELVDDGIRAQLPARDVRLPAELAAGRTRFRDMGMGEAYCGAPAKASAWEGVQLIATLVDLHLEAIRALLAGGAGRDRPRPEAATAC
jgi:creatinine amidohydrolase